MTEENNNINLSDWASGKLSEETSNALVKSEKLEDLEVVLEVMEHWKVPSFDKESELSRINNIIEKPKRGLLVPLKVWYAAASFALFVTLYIGYNQFDNQVIIETGIAENTQHILPEGSIVNMDAVSVLEYNNSNWEKKRIVKLKGQAYFEVTKGGQFTINTNSGNIDVLGTKFNVRSEESKLFVECYEGSVKVKNELDSLILLPFETANLILGELVKGNTTRSEPNWVLGRSVFESAELPLVLSDLEKRYNVSIELPKKYANTKYTGSYGHDNLDNALRSVFAPLGINYTKETNGKIIIE